MISFDLTSLPKVLLIGRRMCSDNWEYAPCIIKNYELVFIYEGEVVFTIDDEITSLIEGDYTLLRPGQTFSARTHPNKTCKYYIVHFNLDSTIVNTTRNAALIEIKQVIDLQNYREMCDVFEMPQIEFKKVFLSQRLILGEYKSMVFNMLEGALYDLNQLTLSSQTMISCYLCQILIILSRITIDNMNLGMNFSQTSQMPRAVKEAIYFIHDNYMKPLNLKDICTKLNVSPQYLIRVFKTILHKTPVQYINLFRISRAKDMLQYTSLSVKEIAYEAGFENPYYFCRVFKKLNFMTPTQYRLKI